jgi:hypothetical protein
MANSINWCIAIFRDHQLNQGRKNNMEYTQITKQVIDFQKISFLNWYDTMAMLQDQATSTMNMVMQQNTWWPEEGRKAIQNWVNACQKERGRLKSYVDEGFADLEKFVAEDKRAAQTKIKKQEG